MVRLLSTLFASLLLTSASAVSAQSTCNGRDRCSASQGGLQPGEHLLNRNHGDHSTILYLTSGDVVMEESGIALWHSNTRGVASNRFRVTNNGRIELSFVSGTISTVVRSVGNLPARTALGNYYMMQDVHVLVVYSAANVIVAEFIPNLDNTMGRLWSLTKDVMIRTLSDAVNIYHPDSGYSSFYDFRFSILDADPRTGRTFQRPIARPVLFQSFSSDPNFNDTAHHSTQGIMIMASERIGVAENTTVHVIKITNGTSLTVREPDVVRSIRATFNHITNKPKVINLSLSFGCDWPQTIKCAMQWAYKSGIVVVAAAGNNNVNCRNRLEYAFVVGGAHGSRFERNGNATTMATSNYGAMLDGWALGSIQDPIRSGSSYASAIAAGAAAHAMTNIASLRNRPAAVFSYMKFYAGNRMPRSLKIQYSPNANNGVIRAVGNTTVPATNWTATAEFCTTFADAGLPTANPTATHWDTLVARAYASNRNGTLVHDSTYDVNARVWEIPVTP